MLLDAEIGGTPTRAALHRQLANVDLMFMIDRTNHHGCYRQDPSSPHTLLHYSGALLFTSLVLLRKQNTYNAHTVSGEIRLECDHVQAT